MGRKHRKSEQKAEEQFMEQMKQTVVDESETIPQQAEETAVREQEIGEEITTEESKIESLTQEIQTFKQIAGDNLEKALRAQAELENIRKRTTRDIENAHKYALERFVTELLPILDSIALGLSALNGTQDVTGLREGMDLTLKMFNTTLEKFGVRAIDPQGEKFNPEKHEAVFMQELEGAESGTVISVAQKGYELNGRLVRPAKVIVAK
ncbi:MAG: nucleotide exchange factor GrpE [Gammaproteobacteria bacterium]|nr:nucleotide exchange factor GrpE [Gammaproteobacteria bacterium]